MPSEIKHRQLNNTFSGAGKCHSCKFRHCSMCYQLHHQFHDFWCKVTRDCLQVESWTNPWPKLGFSQTIGHPCFWYSMKGPYSNPSRMTIWKHESACVTGYKHICSQFGQQVPSETSHRQLNDTFSATGKCISCEFCHPAMLYLLHHQFHDFWCKVPRDCLQVDLSPWPKTWF